MCPQFPIESQMSWPGDPDCYAARAVANSSDRTTMSNFILHVLIKGILAGAFVGLVAGVYASHLTLQNVIKKEDYSHPLYYERAQERYTTAMRRSFLVAFAFCGPFVAAASFGEWIRHAVYGVIGCLGFVVTFSLLISIANFAFGDVSVIASIKFPSPPVRFAQQYGVPAAFLLGPIVGIVFGRYRQRDDVYGCTKL